MNIRSLKSMSTSALIGIVLAISGCGGGGSSSSGGSSAGFAAGDTMVKGTITSFESAAIEFNNATPLLYALNFSAYFVSSAYAENIVEGIKVCIAERCGLTDARGNFEINLDGVPGGNHIISFSYEGKKYLSDIEVVENAVVTLNGISISDDGVVRVSNVRVDTTKDEPDNPGGNVLICHNPGIEQETLEIPESKVAAHKEHGDYLGKCESPGEEKRIPVCHFPGPNQETIELFEEQIPAHKEHGDYIGECEPIGEEEKLYICHNPGPEQDTIKVFESQVPSHKEHGDYLGECERFEEEKFLLCHNAGTSEQENIRVPESEVNAHKEHGDHLGECKRIED